MEAKKITTLIKKMQGLSDTLKKSNCESLVMIFDTRNDEIHTLGTKIGQAFCKSCTDIDIMFIEYCKSYLSEIDRLSRRVGKHDKSELGHVKKESCEEFDTEDRFVEGNTDGNVVNSVMDANNDGSEPQKPQMLSCDLLDQSSSSCKISDIVLDNNDINKAQGSCDFEENLMRDMETKQVNENTAIPECTVIVSSGSDEVTNMCDRYQADVRKPTNDINELVGEKKLKVNFEYNSFLIEEKISDGKCSYFCKLCLLPLQSNVEMTDHIDRHFRDDPYMCKLCGKRFKGKKTLGRHTNSHKQLPHQCEVCLRMFKTTEKLEDHKRSHELVHRCDECERTYDSISRLNFHKKSAHGPRQNTCEKCGASFTQLALLKQHKIRHGPKLYFCDHCNNSYFFHHELQSHLKTHDENSEMYKCNVCSRQYVTKSRLNEHMKIHDGKNFVKCEECGKLYYSKKSLNLHKISAHSREKKFVCQICGKAFLYKHHLNNHLISHDDKRTLKCQYCDATFKKMDILKMHENVHTQEKKFVCDVCGQDFLRMSSLRNHRLKHTPGPGNWKCRYCGDKFRTQSSMLTHVKNNHAERDLLHEKPLCRMCELCGKVFAVGRTYRIHLDMHAGIRRHKCTLCDSSFTDPTNLRAHMKTHNGSFNRHKCPVCEMSFASEKQYTIHMGKHSKNSVKANLLSSVHVSTSNNSLSDNSIKISDMNSSVAGDPDLQTINSMTHCLEPVNGNQKNCDEEFNASLESTHTTLDKHNFVVSMENTISTSGTETCDDNRIVLIVNDTLTMADSLRQSMNVRNTDHPYTVLS